MAEIELLQSIGIMIVAAAALVLLTRRLNVPTIVLYIVTGLLLGPITGIMTVEPVPVNENGADQMVGDIASIGIALLLFLVGLELSFQKIRDVGPVSLIAGVGQVAATMLLAMPLSLALGFSAIESAFIAAALTNSSTVLVVKLLDQKRETNRTYAHIAVGQNLVKDIVLILVLAFLAGLAGAEEAAGGADVLRAAFQTLLGVIVLGSLVVAASRYVVEPLFRWTVRTPETLLIWSLCWCSLFVIGAEWFGMSPGIGAFLAGLSLAQFHAANDLRRRLHPLMSFFLAIFFIAVGVQMEPAGAMEYWKAAVVLGGFILLINPLICIVIISRFGFGRRTSFLAGATMGQISELSFIFIAVGMAAGAIDGTIVSLVTVLGLITISISAYMILYNEHMYRWLNARQWLRFFPVTGRDDCADVPTLSNHIVIVGMNDLGRSLVRQLHEQGETVLAIDSDPSKLGGLPCRTMHGNIEYPSVLEEARLGHAKLGISTLHINDANDLFAYHCKRMGVPMAIHAFDRSVFDDLRRLGVDYLIDSKAQGNTELATRLYEKGVVSA